MKWLDEILEKYGKFCWDGAIGDLKSNGFGKDETSQAIAKHIEATINEVFMDEEADFHTLKQLRKKLLGDIDKTKKT